jgi:hypothetical protein
MKPTRQHGSSKTGGTASCSCTSNPETRRASRLRRTRAPPTGVSHAIALFRARSATEHDKRSAVVALPDVVEVRRGLIETASASKHEGALLPIANQFAIRHQGGHQQGVDDPMFLDRLFWSHLATVELTDRLVARERGSGTSRPS